MRVLSVHPGIGLETVVEMTGFELVVAEELTESRSPTDEELRLLREVIDPDALRDREIRS